jgi:hypothetical protein
VTDDLFSYAAQARPVEPREEPSATLFPDAAPPGVEPCSGDCVWIEFGLATAAEGCEMCRVVEVVTPGVYVAFFETVRAVFGDVDR